MRARTMLSIGGWLSGINIFLVVALAIVGLPRLGEPLFALVVIANITQLVAVVFFGFWVRERSQAACPGVAGVTKRYLAPQETEGFSLCSIGLVAIL